MVVDVCKGAVESKGLFTLIKSEAKMPVKATMSIKMHVVITIVYHTVVAEHQILYHVGEKMMARLKQRVPLWFKLMRIHISTELV